MRKWICRLLLSACILSLLALGYFMPYLAGEALDRSLSHGAWEMEDRGVSLTLTEETDALSRMELFTQIIDHEHTAVELQEGGELAGIGAKAAAEQVMDRLGGISVLDAAVPYLLTGEDKSGQTRSGIFWRCVRDAGSESEGMIWIDDQTGLLMGFDLPADMFYFLGEGRSWEVFATQVLEFCVAHYSVNGLYSDRLREDETDAKDPKKGVETPITPRGMELAVHMELTRDEGSISYTALLEIGADRIRFNMTEHNAEE